MRQVEPNVKTNGFSFEPDRRKNDDNYQATVADAEALRRLMFEQTGRSETVSTALGWLRLAPRADGWADVEQQLQSKLVSHKPWSNAWFKTVIQNQFSVSPDEAESQRSDVIRDYRAAIALADPAERSLAAQRCVEEAQACGIPPAVLMATI